LPALTSRVLTLAVPQSEYPCFLVLLAEKLGGYTAMRTARTPPVRHHQDVGGKRRCFVQLPDSSLRN
jgi:hypothetical protein